MTPRIETRKKRLLYNTVASFLYQVAAFICGFILPRLILSAYGSEVNGLVNSITQFLGFFGFMELGIGSVIQSSLYKPLATEDTIQVSRLMSSANKFFTLLARLLLLYVIILVVFYPMFVKQSFGYAYTAILIVAMSISSFAQYYFGIVNRLLLNADQRGHVQYNTQTIAVILNTAACYFLVKIGSKIQIVKFATSSIFLLQPLVVNWYVSRHYKINKKESYIEEPIKQKWNGIAQHIAAVVLDGTDIMVLTIFSTLSSVSIYSVYYMVVKGVKQLFLSMTNGIQSLMGELWASGEEKKLKELFGWTEWAIHTGTTFVFGLTAFLIVPFIMVYTKGVKDIDYFQPLFGYLLVASNAGHCLRLPYNIMILAGGHYKQTQSSYIIAAALNVIISILAVRRFGLIGVTIGTLIAMMYQTTWMAWYVSKNLIKWPYVSFVKHLLVDLCTIVAIVALLKLFSLDQGFTMTEASYAFWCVLAVKTTAVALVTVLGINLIFYGDYIVRVFNNVKTILTRAGGGGRSKEVNSLVSMMKGRCAYAY